MSRPGRLQLSRRKVIAKQDYGVFLERFAHCAIGSVVGCHVDQIDPAQLRGEPRPQGDESHALIQIDR